MSAISLAIIGKNNEPLYVKEFFDEKNPKSDLLSEHELFGLNLALHDGPSTRTDGNRVATKGSQRDIYFLGNDGPLEQQQGDDQEEEEVGEIEEDPSRMFTCSLRQQFMLHAALDRFEQLAGPPPGLAWRTPGMTGNDAMWVGLLCPVEDMRIYGYMTTTNIKFILTVEDDSFIGDQRTVDESIKRLLVKIHRLYVEYVLNPMNPCILTSGRIVSNRFDMKVNECVLAYNRLPIK